MEITGMLIAFSWSCFSTHVYKEELPETEN